ncbi:hypothetical protein Ancab_019839 [Ancistrocladus abbreviatus]
MAPLSSIVCRCSLLPTSPQKGKTINTLSHSQFLSSKSLQFSSLGFKFKLPQFRIKPLISPNSSSVPIIFASQSNFFRVLQTVVKVGKDGIEAGTNLVPDSVPRPVARLSVTVAAVAVSLFILKSFLSTALFALGVMGFVYFIYLALNKDKGPTVEEGPKSTDEAVEEARRIMDKYK